jgi:PAS domain S-box-containing protein
VNRLEQEAVERGRGESEERFRHMADTAPAMMWMSGSDSLCTFFNRRWLEYRGRALEEEIGNGWTEGVQAEDRDRCLETYLACFHERQEFRMEYRLRRRFHRLRRFVQRDRRSLTEAPPTAADARRSAADTPRSAGSDADRRRQIHQGHRYGAGISYKTADSHRTRIMDKLGVHETASLVRSAIRMGLVKP